MGHIWPKRFKLKVYNLDTESIGQTRYATNLDQPSSVLFPSDSETSLPSLCSTTSFQAKSDTKINYDSYAALFNPPQNNEEEPKIKNTINMTTAYANFVRNKNMKRKLHKM